MAPEVSDTVDFEMLRKAAAFVYVDDVDAPQPSDEDVHHLLSVLRLRAKETVIACDGAGAYVACELADGAVASRGRGKKGPVATDVLVATDEVRRVEKATLPRTVAFAVPKGERAEWTVQKLCEIGIDTIIPITSARSVVRLDAADAARRRERFARIAREAGAQSRRLILPELCAPMRFEQLLSELDGIDGVALCEPGGAHVTQEITTLLVGPEGGWSEDELGAVVRHIDLGPTVLRSETAAIVAGTLLVARREGLLS